MFITKRVIEEQSNLNKYIVLDMHWQNEIYLMSWNDIL